MQLLADEVGGELAHAASDKRVELKFAYDVVRALRAEAQKDHCHIDIVLDAAEVGAEPARCGAVLVLKGQAHGRDGRFYLVHPDGEVVERIAHAPLRVGGKLGAAFGKQLDDAPIVLIVDALRRRQQLLLRGGQIV